MRSLRQRISVVTCAVALAGIVGLAPVAHADCTACGSTLITCGQSVLVPFQSCITAARTKAAAQMCIAAAGQGLNMCQANFNACIAACTPAS